MTLQEIIDGLQMTIDLCLYNPNTGETITEPRNDMDKTTVDACKGAIELLEQVPCENVPDLYECPCGYGWDKNKVVRHHFCPNCGRAVDGSIKTEQEPCDDCISRENTLKAMIEQLGIRNEDYLIPAEATLYKVVKNMPPVTPQQKMGKWLIKRINDCDHAICSVCNDDSYLSPEWDALELYKYCPNCGSKMSEVNHDQRRSNQEYKRALLFCEPNSTGKRSTRYGDKSLRARAEQFGKAKDGEVGMGTV